MSALPLPVLALAFLASAAVIWAAGIRLADTTDALADRLGLGEALGGIMLLAVATNLPEIAITTSASATGELGVAVGNLLGGIAVQTVVLAVIDAAGPRPRRPLTYLAASLLLVLQAALVLALLLAVIAGAQLPADLIIARLAPGPIAIAALWVVGLLVVRAASRGLPWAERDDDGDEPASRSAAPAAKPAPPRRAGLVFGVAAALTLAAGVLIEQSGEAMAARAHVSGVVLGATALAAATALPEVSTGLEAARAGDYRLAVGDVLEGNAFLPVLFLLASLVSGTAVLPAADRSDVYLTALGGLLTVVYLVGLVLRPRRQALRMGPDSIAVVALYAVGIAGLVLVR